MDKAEALGQNTTRSDKLEDLEKQLDQLRQLLIDLLPSGFREIELELIASLTVFGQIPSDGMT